MLNEQEILKIYNQLNDLLENAPSDEELNDSGMIDFYADAQNLKETIERLQINKSSKNDLNCYIVDCTLKTIRGDSFKHIMVFSKDIEEAKDMLNATFVVDGEEDFMDYDSAKFEKVRAEDYGVEYPNKPQFRILLGNNVIL